MLLSFIYIYNFLVFFGIFKTFFLLFVSSFLCFEYFFVVLYLYNFLFDFVLLYPPTEPLIAILEAFISNSSFNFMFVSSKLVISVSFESIIF